MAHFDIEKLDDIIHSRLRLGVMAILTNSDSATFSELKSALNASQGNLSVQIRKLEDAGYVDVDKRIVKRKPLTTLRLTAEGRIAFAAYISTLSEVVGMPLGETP